MRVSPVRAIPEARVYRRRTMEGPASSLPVIMAVDADPDALGRVGNELTKRYGADYEVVCSDSPSRARAKLEDLKRLGREVAVVLAAQFMPGMSGTDLLIQTHQLFPRAKRALLIAWGDTSASDPLRRAMAFGQIDFFVQEPLGPREEGFHRTIAEFLDEWALARGIGVEAIRIVGERWSRRSHEMRSLLERYGVPFSFLPVETTEGARLLADVGVSAERLPVLVFFDGRVFVDPEYPEVADALGANAEIGGRTQDLTIVGAGPAGLAAAVYGASEGLETFVVEREAIGGQAGSTSRIRNYLGFPRGVSGGELAQRAYLQAWLLGARFSFLRAATDLRGAGSGLALDIAGAGECGSRTVVLALGVTYRRLGIASLEALVGAGVFYGAAASEARAIEGEEVCVVGGANSAGQAALHLARYASRVTLVVRGDSLEAGMSHYLIEELSVADNVAIRLGTRVVGGGGTGRLENVVLQDRAGIREELAVSALFVLIGSEPHTEWLPDRIARDERGFILVGKDAASSLSWPLTRPPLQFETTMPGVFAIGDVRHGSVKRIASAVGDGAIVVKLVHEFLRLARPPLPAN